MSNIHQGNIDGLRIKLGADLPFHLATVQRVYLSS